MIIEYVHYRVPAGQTAAFEEACRKAAQALSASPHCRTYDLSRNENRYTLRITWTTPQEIPELAGYESASHREEPIDLAPTLYEWAGGAEAFERLFTAFYAKVAEDPVLAPVFAGMHPDHPKHVALWLGEVFGGSKVYSERHGGHRHMISRHLGRALTEKHRRQWVNLLIDTADEADLPSDAEFRSAFVGYLEWGTRMALMFSRPGVEAEVAEPMPTWSWGEVRPWF
ncbi:group II truncated hemoglobin [Kibdelosporangium persicum]|uniref:Antibiotic biosynthesis monooxygenase n=1 Tax=Kibdelosporangium persicum TaxID=2698649 RepID=A0ABX2F9X0_9PSEU|nr:antibiotic biosynthesis monooxygenase [Kibdelosporangium persicum]NRN68166.1 Antibiotic biosynthesis monooxygenase [Kibdelosporangium persicum]